MISRMLAFAVAVLTLLGSGLMYHTMARDSEELDLAVQSMGRVPMQIGDWIARPVEPDAEDERSFAQAGAKGYWTRTYINQHTNDSVLVILMCGRAGKMAVHTPDVCYRGAGFEVLDAPSVCVGQDELGEERFRFWTGRFSKKASTTTNVRLYWAWNARGVWEASANPRWQYRGEPYLFKLYVSRDLGFLPKIAPQADPAADFLRQLLPELKAALFLPDNPA